MYNHYTGLALKLTDGDQQKADYILNCSVYDFYYRYKSIQEFMAWKNENSKPKS
ncbi:hypothetical protein [Chryseobacterium sp.]|uniref:hypothetical protein n=1 Tax=Chryseobacterium sp. TaxID=1871047 RepID=UPI0031CF4CD9